MEMQQIRYFLALARTLNFTRAAEDCNVSQSALTRAIKALEGELGGELIRREHSGSHLTELGKRMMPFMQQCYESAATAKALAVSLRHDDVTPITVAISHSVNPEVAMQAISQAFRAFPGMQLKMLRTANAEILETLRRGDADLALAGPVEEGWERLDRWPLFEEPMELAVKSDHALAQAPTVELGDIARERLVCLSGCEMRQPVGEAFLSRGMDVGATHETATQNDLNALVERGLGLAIVARSAPQTTGAKRVTIKDLGVRRQVCVYVVAGRRREPVANTLLNLLRSGAMPATSTPQE
jgi:DNA-binding transcriptional LysR family regulator